MSVDRTFVVVEWKPGTHGVGQKFNGREDVEVLTARTTADMLNRFLARAVEAEAEVERLSKKRHRLVR